jgi:hypothetical protein
MERDNEETGRDNEEPEVIDTVKIAVDRKTPLTYLAETNGAAPDCWH